MKHAEVRSALLVAVLAVTLLVLSITYSPPSTASAALNQYVWMKTLNTTISSIWVGDANYTVVIVGGCVLAVNTSSSASFWEFAPENATVLAAAVLGMVNTDGLYGISCIVANRSQTYLALLNGSSGSIVWTLPAENTTLLATVANRTGDNFTDLIAVDTTIRLIDGATGRIIWEKALNATGTALTLTNSSLVATSCNDTRILWWNVSDGTLLAQIAFNATQLATWNASAVIALNSSHVSLVTLTNILWTLPVNNAFTAFSLSDVNGDGEAELLVVNSSTAFWVNASSGMLLHRVALNGSIVDAATLPPIWANASDCGYELVVGNDTVIACLDGAFPQTQRFLWTANLTEATRATSLLHVSALAVTPDIDGDGHNEVLAAAGKWLVLVSGYDYTPPRTEVAAFVSDNMRVKPGWAFDASQLPNSTVQNVSAQLYAADSSWLAFCNVSVDGGEWQPIGSGLERCINTSYRLGDLGPGQHTFSVRARDAFGNEKEATYVVFVDSDLPQVRIRFIETREDPRNRFRIYDPENGTWAGVNTRVVWEGSDNDSEIWRYEFYNITEDQWVNVGMGNTFDLHGLSEGNHTIQIRAYDRANHTTVFRFVIRVDATPPEVVIRQPTPDAALNVHDVTVAWTAKDNQSGIAILAHVWYDDESPQDVENRSSTRLTNVPEGYHTIYVEVYDVAGNAASASVNVTVDCTAPYIHILSINGYPPEPEPIVNETQVTVVWEASDELSGLTSIEVRLGFGEWIQLSANTTTYTFQNASYGFHWIEVRAHDAAGNLATARSGVWVRSVSATRTMPPPLTSLVVLSIVLAIVAIAAAALTTYLLLRSLKPR